jgi:hypothetical protein
MKRVACLAIAFALAIAPTRGEVPTGTPAFSNPLSIDNTYFPFVVGVEKTFVVQNGNADHVTLEHFTSGTRTFLWNGNPVETRVLEEQDIEDGETVEISKNYFAQADDGTVYYFGEVVDLFDGGVIVSHSGSWLVGGPTEPTDPPETATDTDPNVFMPAVPEVEDEWKPEDLFPVVDETVEVVKTGTTVTVPVDSFTDCIKLEESSLLAPEIVHKWYAPGLGFIKSKEQGEILVLTLVVTP